MSSKKLFILTPKLLKAVGRGFIVLGIAALIFFFGYLLNIPYISQAASGVVNYTSDLVLQAKSLIVKDAGGTEKARFNDQGASHLGGLTASDIMAQSGGGAVVLWGWI